MDTLSTLELRPVLPSDMDTYFEFHVDPEGNHMAAFTAPDPNDRAAFDAHWAKILADPTLIAKTIVVGDEVVGSVGKFVMFDLPQVTYRVGRQHWGKGIATRALNLLLSEYRERPIYAMAAFDNAASIRVLTKCGFRETRRETGFANARGAEIEEIVFQLD